MSKKPIFPLTIKSGSVRVKIYRSETTRTTAGFLYQVAWNDGGGRKVRQFAKLEDAKAEAQLTAERIAAGRTETDISRADLDLLAAVKREAGKASPTEIIAEWKRAKVICEGNLIEAAKFWAAAHSTDFQKAKIEEVVEAFLAAKESEGINIRRTYRGAYFDSLRNSFPNVPINSITSRDISRHLTQFKDPVYRNTHRRRIVTLFRWAARQGYLPQNAKTQAELTDTAKENEAEIEIYTPTQYKETLELVARKYPHYLAAVVLAGFCGMRRSEVHSQVWEDIDLEAGTVTVTKAKPRTPQDRIVPIPPAAQAWLFKCQDRKGKVCFNLAMDMVRRFAKDAKIATPANGLRHSYISYQMGLGNSAGQVAQWAGNTERQIHKHYRRPRPKSEAEAFFALSPAAVLEEQSNVIELQEVAQ